MAIKIHSPIVKSTLWHSEEQTQAFASRWAQVLQQRAELSDLLVTLHGNLGAGKTTLVRHLLRALGITGPIKSPTYALVESYTATPALPIWHFDFYRLSDPRQWQEAGLHELLSQSGLKLIEWPEQAGPELPTADIAIYLSVPTHTTRAVTVQAYTSRGQEVLHAMEPLI